MVSQGGLVAKAVSLCYSLYSETLAEISSNALLPKI